MTCNETLLSNALMFDNAYNILNEKMNIGINQNDMINMALCVPVAVNCAFSCELFLKAMLPMGFRWHKLYSELFVQLDNISKEAIIDGTLKLMKLHIETYSEKDFYNDLQKNEKAFEIWRYFHESMDISPSFDNRFMSCFQKNIKSLAIFYSSSKSDNMS